MNCWIPTLRRKMWQKNKNVLCKINRSMFLKSIRDKEGIKWQEFQKNMEKHL